jgi:serine/threonine protein kinase
MKLNNPCLQCNEIISASLEEMRHLGSCPHCQQDPGQMDCAIKESDTLADSYTIQQKISEDDFGTIYLATDEQGTTVQVKTLPPQMHRDQEAEARFLREIELLTKIRHDSIISVLESGQDEGVVFLITEYKEGINLKDFLADQGKLNEKDAVHLINPLIDALNAIWTSDKIVHRDIKPEKIFLTDDNQIKFIDVGLAKSLDNEDVELTGAGFTLGTPNYISPEQAEGADLDFKTDMYSLGLVFYELLTGQQAFDGPVMEVLSRQMNEMPTPISELNSSITERCIKIIDKMIAKKPAERFGSWDECREALILLLDCTVMESDLQNFDLSDLIDDDDEPSMESLNTEDDGVFGGQQINASGIIIQEDEADNDLQYSDDKPTIDSIEAGSIIGNGYEIDRKVGDGSMGEIYLAFSEERNSVVQIKVLPAHMTNDNEKVERFLQEIKITASLAHPNLLSVIEAGEDNGRYYLVTEYEEGVSFHDYIGRYGPLHEKDSLSFLIQIAEVLQYAWKEKKLLHREIKPSNILIKNESKEAKLTDFGVAKVLSEDTLNLTGMGFTIGTPEYMSPEQVCGDEDLDSRSDMYAIGLVLYEALAKTKAFESDNVMTLMNMQMNQPHENIKKLNPKVSDNCSQLIDRLLEKDRNNRFNDWTTLISSMRRVLEGKEILPQQEPKPQKPLTQVNLQAAEQTSTRSDHAHTENNPKKSPLLLISSLVVVIVIIILGYLLTR